MKCKRFFKLKEKMLEEENKKIEKKNLQVIKI